MGKKNLSVFVKVTSDYIHFKGASVQLSFLTQSPMHRFPRAITLSMRAHLLIYTFRHNPTPQFRPADISRSRRNTSYSELNTFVLVSPTQIKHSMEVFRIRTGYPCPAFSLKLPPFERTTIFEGYLQEASRTCTPGM